MQRALSLFILLALFAPLFPVPLIAQEVGTATPPVDTASTTPEEEGGEEGAQSAPSFSLLSAPSDESFVPAISGTVISESPASAWNPANWTGSQTINYPYGSINIAGDPNFIGPVPNFVQDGRVTTITMPLGFTRAPDDLVTFQLTSDPAHGWYDCKTQTKTAAQWGLGTTPGSFNTVTIGPFDGAHCDTRIQRKDLGTHLTAGVDGVYGSFVTMPVTSDGATPIVVYAANPPGATRITADITADRTLESGQIYVVSGTVLIAPGATVTVEPGAIVKFDHHSGLSVYGSFIAHGTSTNPIYLTSFTDDAVGGDTNEDGTTLAQAGNWDGIVSNGGTISIESAIVRYGSYRMLVGDKNTLSIHTSSITNAVDGIHNYDWSPQNAVSAENNWWGDANGPASAGSQGTNLYGAIAFTPWLTSDPFFVPTPTCTENCNSSVLFLPGIQGSALEEGGDVRWPASLWSQDVARLALTESGESVNDVKVLGVLGNFYPSTNLYGGFATFMDSQVANQKIEAWVPFAYDWRFSPEKILEDGVSTPTGIVDLMDTFDQLAASSKNGKVTIVAHSMGGLLGKALIKKLQEEGKDDLLDAFVMVGTPQLGTPQAEATLLHGDQPLVMDLFVRSHALRSVAQNMRSAYDLLPGEEYFNDVVSPVVSFDSNAHYTQPWRNQWQDTLNTYPEFTEFLTGTGVARTHPQSTDLGTPEVLDPVLLIASKELHSDLDNYPIPAHIRVVQVAGWGLPTTKTVMYWNSHVLGVPTPLRGYKTIPTIEGDQTVVYPSAISSSGEAYFFNLALFNNRDDGHDFDHKDLLNTDPVQTVVRSVIENAAITPSTYILGSLPSVSDVPEQLLIVTRSPIVLGVYDNQGNFTGINPNQDLNSETLAISKGIPNSNFLASGEDQYIFLPKGGNYTFTFKGTGTGPATVETATFVNDEIHPTSTYTDIPVTSATTATFVVNTDTSGVSSIEIDQNGDNQPDSYVAPDGGILSLSELITNLKTAVSGLSTTKPQQKTQLLNRIANIENKIAKQKQKQSNVLSKLKAQIEKKAGKGRIDTTTANVISGLLDQLIAQSALFPLEPALLQQLKDQISSANITTALKTNLLAKVFRLENFATVNRSLNTMTQSVIKKGTRGVLTEAETQNLLNLLDQLQAAI